MTRLYRSLPLLVALALAASCGSDSKSSPVTVGGEVTTVAPTDTSGGGAGSTVDLCTLVSEADMAVLFPEATPQPSRGTAENCAWDVLWASNGGSGVFNMGEIGLPYDDSLASNSDQYEVSQLDGIGDRAYYFSHYLMFEVNGTTYDLSVGNYDQSHQPDPAAEQDTLMRIAAAYAALLAG